MPEHKRLVDVAEMARILNVSKSWLYKKTSTNEIPCFHIGKYRRFAVDRVLRWAEDKKFKRKKQNQKKH